MQPYKFVPTQEEPLLSELTNAYDNLSEAIGKVRDATSDARQAENSLDGARTAKDPGEEYTHFREVEAKVASVQEQSVRKPLIDAMTKMRRALEGVIDDHKFTARLPAWLHEARRINVICAVELIKKAFVVYQKIRAHNASFDKTLARDYCTAAASSLVVPELPPCDGSLESNKELEFLMLCVKWVMDAGGSLDWRLYWVPTTGVDQVIVERVSQRLHKARWTTQIQDNGSHLWVCPPEQFQYLMQPVKQTGFTV